MTGNFSVCSAAVVSHGDRWQQPAAERPMGHCLVCALVLVNMEDCGSVWELLSCSNAAGAGLLLSPSKVHCV